jgi:hypothetical protein
MVVLMLVSLAMELELVLVILLRHLQECSTVTSSDGCYFYIYHLLASAALLLYCEIRCGDWKFVTNATVKTLNKQRKMSETWMAAARRWYVPVG